jgi:hypothetical protein
LLIAALLFLPHDAEADDRCLEARALRGNVRTVLIHTGKIAADTGVPLNKPFLWERWDISRDRRTITVVQYSADGPNVMAFFNLWPTTICEFDEAGRLVKSRLKLNGLTTHRTVETSYDPQGRMVAVKSRSPHPELTGDTLYEYSGNAVTARFPAGNATTSITERDASGRINREVSRDQKTGVELSDVEYRYGAGTVEIVGREEGKVAWLVSKKLDALGSTLESSSSGRGFESREISRFDYDAKGNWTRRVTSRLSSVTAPSRVADLDLRQVTYWP